MTDTNDDNFLKTIFSFGLIIRADIEEIQTLKKYLGEKGIKICYQKTSTNRLQISESLYRQEEGF